MWYTSGLSGTYFLPLSRSIRTERVKVDVVFGEKLEYFVVFFKISERSISENNHDHCHY
jgi:hypothetical protein